MRCETVGHPGTESRALSEICRDRPGMSVRGRSGKYKTSEGACHWMGLKGSLLRENFVIAICKSLHFVNFCL